MDIFFLILGFILMLLGIVGSFMPVLPGTPVSWLGLLMLYLSPSIEQDWWFLGITGFIAILIYVLDYIIPAMGTKRFGGSKAGVWGAVIGLIVGLFSPIPFGIIIGPFVGALMGELLVTKKDGKQAFKAAFGSFLGFIASTFMKFFATVIYLILFIIKVWEYRAVWF